MFELIFDCMVSLNLHRSTMTKVRLELETRFLVIVSCSTLQSFPEQSLNRHGNPSRMGTVYGTNDSVADPGFPRGGGANPQGWGTNLLFGQKFPENCMKMKEFGPRRGARVPGTPLRSANECARDT